MANSLLKKVIGEAAFADRGDGTGRYDDGTGERIVPSSTVDLSAVGQAIGSAPPGRQYPEMPPPQLTAAIANEEKRELQIARRLKTLASQSWGNSRNMPEGRSIRTDIEALADELIEMHTQKPPA